MEVTKELGGVNYVFWGGREGYSNLYNTDLKRELDHLAKFFHLAVDYKKKIGFTGQFLIEPKPKEPTVHQYDFDCAAVHRLPARLRPGRGLQAERRDEPRHAGRPHDDARADLRLGATGMLGSIDANRGDLLLGWDTDQFPTDLYLTTQCMLVILGQGGLAPGGVNFDAKVRRESFEPVDLFHAHIGGMDAFAHGLKIAAKIRADGVLNDFVKQRYASWDERHRPEDRGGAGELRGPGKVHAGEGRRDSRTSRAGRRCWRTSSTAICDDIMAELTRVSISLETALLEAFDRINASKGYATRSEAVRDLIRERLIREEASGPDGDDAESVAVVTLVYDHHARELAARLIDKQHHHHEIVVSTMHVHLGSGIVWKCRCCAARPPLVRHLGEELTSVKGVLHGEITFTSGEKAFSRWGGEARTPALGERGFQRLLELGRRLERDLRLFHQRAVDDLGEAFNRPRDQGEAGMSVGLLLRGIKSDDIQRVSTLPPKPHGKECSTCRAVPSRGRIEAALSRNRQAPGVSRASGPTPLRPLRSIRSKPLPAPSGRGR